MTDTTTLLRALWAAEDRKMEAQVREMEIDRIESRLKRGRRKSTSKLGRKVTQAWRDQPIDPGLGRRVTKEWK